MSNALGHAWLSTRHLAGRPAMAVSLSDQISLSDQKARDHKNGPAKTRKRAPAGCDETFKDKRGECQRARRQRNAGAAHAYTTLSVHTHGYTVHTHVRAGEQ